MGGVAGAGATARYKYNYNSVSPEVEINANILDPLPVPAEILVYTESEWARLEQEGGRFFTTIAAESVWL